MSREKDTALQNGQDALKSLDEVSSISYEGGDGGEDTEWYNDYRVWPTQGQTKEDIARACENHYGDNYIFTVSATEDEHDYIYVTVRTTVE